MAELNAALIGLLGVMAGGYFNNFLAEDYRRFRDGQALACALAGELQGHANALPHIKSHLLVVINHLKFGDNLESPEWDAPGSPIFEANTAKIGLLRPNDAFNVAYAYEEIRSFREKLRVVAKNHGKLSGEWCLETLRLAGSEVELAQEILAPLLGSLSGYATESYRNRPETRRLVGSGALAIGAFLLFLKLFF